MTEADFEQTAFGQARPARGRITGATGRFPAEVRRKFRGPQGRLADSARYRLSERPPGRVGSLDVRSYVEREARVTRMGSFVKRRW